MLGMIFRRLSEESVFNKMSQFDKKVIRISSATKFFRDQMGVRCENSDKMLIGTEACAIGRDGDAEHFVTDGDETDVRAQLRILRNYAWKVGYQVVQNMGAVFHVLALALVREERIWKTAWGTGRAGVVVVGALDGEVERRWNGNRRF